MSARRLGCVACLAGSFAIVAACLPNPKKDFEDYSDKTADYRKSGPKDGGDIDSAPPTQAVEGLYFGACLSKLAAGRIDRVLRFYTESKFTPGAGGAASKLTMKITPMKLGPNNSAPAAFVKSETIGDTFTIDSVDVDARGVFPGALGTVKVPGAANPISGRDIVIENTSLNGRYAEEKFCTQLAGHVVQPTDIELIGDDNTCLFFKTKEGDPLPAINVAMFDPGCPL
jgi:hypothetical protein